ncbi:1385_t:CDS:1, partial [Funneliformis geosporum]
DKYITFEEVEEILKHQNDLDDKDTLITSYLINDENEPVERIKLINKYSQCGEENHHITIDEDVECCHMQHMDSVELEEILGYQKYMDEHISDDVVVKEDVQDLIISTETPKPKENIFEVAFEELYLDNCKFPIIDLPPPYEELSSFKSNDVNFNEFKIFILTHHQVDSSNPLWNVDNVQDFEEMCSKTFKDFNIKVQYANFINNVQYNQIKRINPSYEQAPSYEQLSSSKSNEVNFNEFKKFLLEHHNIDSSHQLWKIDNLKDFEELYSITFSNSSPQDRYTNFVNNVQQNI